MLFGLDVTVVIGSFCRTLSGWKFRLGASAISSFNVNKRAISLLNDNSIENEIKMARRIWDMNFGEMSPGERRRLIIFSYCKINRSVYIFDEPTSGVDSNSKVSVLNQIKNLTGKIVILSTHTLHDLEQIEGNIILLHEGEITFEGNDEELLRKVTTKVLMLVFNT